ncbi:ParB/RepB/Spo0J family partition protein [Streptococcus merionis]|uniref:Chromosome segregation protein n=1 Tax=Streptococcus merionis TaxID=400065 RepID=A0A239SZT5_9STRE|nr:ParB/RepB/Spo0J family partition protein [Streptococcus merionis]SNU90388.1 chromosome segregation protein [Streptococcus merionis]
MNETFAIINIKDIQTNPYQPRQHFEPEKLSELAQSIRENGIIQPLIVRKSAIVGYELMAGERRLRASQLAGLEKVPAIIKELSDHDMMTQAIIENLQRHDLNPIEEARAYKRLMDKGNTHEVIAQTVGKSRPYISNSVRLLNLSDTVLDAVEKGQISQAHARTLLSLEDSISQEQWLEKIINQNISVRKLEQLLQPPQSKENRKTTDLFSQNAAKKLSQQLGTKVTISEKKGSGSIKIQFSSLEEFERLMHMFK